MAVWGGGGGGVGVIRNQLGGNDLDGLTSSIKESAFKNTPIHITFTPLQPFHKNFLKIWASDLVGAKEY